MATILPLQSRKDWHSLTETAEKILPEKTRKQITQIWKEDQDLNELLAKRAKEEKKSQEYKNITKSVKSRIRKLRNEKFVQKLMNWIRTQQNVALKLYTNPSKTMAPHLNEFDIKMNAKLTIDIPIKRNTMERKSFQMRYAMIMGNALSPLRDFTSCVCLRRFLKNHLSTDLPGTVAMERQKRLSTMCCCKDLLINMWMIVRSTQITTSKSIIGY